MSDPSTHNDRDFDLARRIGEALDKGAPPTTDFDPSNTFESALHSFKLEANSEPLPNTASAEIWAEIEQQTQTSSRPRLAVIRAFRSSQVWRVAAAVVVLLGLIWFFSNRSDVPILLAETGDATEAYTWPDGSTATLRPHSRLMALSSNAELVRVQLEGEGFFDVTSNPTRTFQVEAGAGRIDVLGTRFNVSTWGNQTLVFLEEGRVSFSQQSIGQHVLLEPGQSSRLSQGILEDAKVSDQNEYLDWTRGELNFSGRPVRDVLAELEHHFAVTFQMQTNFQNETLTGRILLEDKAQSISDLGLVLGGQFVAIGTNMYRFESE